MIRMIVLALALSYGITRAAVVWTEIVIVRTFDGRIR